MNKIYATVLLLFAQNTFSNTYLDPIDFAELLQVNEITLSNVSRARIQEYKDKEYLSNDVKTNNHCLAMPNDEEKFQCEYNSLRDFNKRKLQEYLDKEFKIRIKDNMIIVLFEQGEMLVVDRFATWDRVLTKKELRETVRNYVKFENVRPLFNESLILQQVVKAKLDPVFIDKKSNITPLEADSSIVKKMLEEIAKNKQHLLLN